MKSVFVFVLFGYVLLVEAIPQSESEDRWSWLGGGTGGRPMQPGGFGQGGNQGNPGGNQGGFGGNQGGQGGLGGNQGGFGGNQGGQGGLGGNQGGQGGNQGGFGGNQGGQGGLGGNQGGFDGQGGLGGNQGGQVVDPNQGAVVTTTQMPVQQRQCIESCQTTQQYNPVCGSDNVTYNNAARLRCAQRCGVNVTQVRMGACQAL